MKQLHDVQLQILKKLLFADCLRYSDMKPDSDMENNKFDFHLDKLIELEYVIKIDDKYTLTSLGKEYANRMDTEKNKIMQQAKIGVLLGCTRLFEGQRQYLIYTRLKQPFYGCQGFMTGKVSYGESVLETARRKLKEETNLEGNPVLVGIRHYRVYDKKAGIVSTAGTGRDLSVHNRSVEDMPLVEDKFFYFCKIDEPKGELIGNNEGRFEWVGFDDLKSYITNPFESMDVIIKLVEEVRDFSGDIYFEEIEEYSEKF